MTTNQLKTLSEMMKDWLEPGIVADYLYDAEAAQSDVLRLYAGQPPFWLNGLTKDVLDLWLANNGDPEVAYAVACLHDGHPRSQLATLNVVFPGGDIELGEDMKVKAYRPAGWRSHLEDLHVGNRKNRPCESLYCPDCRKERRLTSLDILMTAMCDFVAYSCACFPCPCGSVLLWFDPAEWTHVRRAKRRILEHFPHDFVPELRGCACEGSYMAFMPCRTCDGRNFFATGKMVAAAQLIYNP